MRSTCPVCSLDLRAPAVRDPRDSIVYDCVRCGTFVLTDSAEADTRQPLEAKSDLRFLLSHYIRKMQRSNSRPLVRSETCRQILEEERLPSAREQSDNLIRWLGEYSLPGTSKRLTADEHGGIVGCVGHEGYRYIVDAAIAEKLIAGERELRPGYPTFAALTFSGWDRYEELRRGASTGQSAFMAMPFGNVELDSLYRSVFQPAVAETGFLLRRLDEPPKIGLIDDRLRVDIKACRFLVADLSDGNAGAYWEAGYAEGLGKPVIYTCSAAAFKDPGRRPHFDTNHHHTVFWPADDRGQDVATMLKATIRASIPEAKQT